MVHKGTSSSYRLVECIGFDLAWFSSLSSERLCVFGSVFMVLYNFVAYILLYLLVS